MRTRLNALVSVFALAFALRLIALDGPALRGDEAHTVLGWSQTLPVVLEEMAVVDPHPPLAYLAFNVWLDATGDSEFAARYLSALAGTLAIAAVYAVGRRALGPQTGMLAALLWAVNPFQVWHSQDARNYALWVLLSALAVWLMLRATVRGRALDWSLYVVVEAAAAYTFYLELFLLAFQNVYVVLSRRRDRAVLRQWVTAQALVALLLAPWYLQPRLWAGGYGGTAGSLDPGRVFTWVAPTLVFGETLPPEILGWLWAPTWALIGAGLVFVWRAGRRRFFFLATYAGVPLALLCALSAVRPVFRPRYILASAPAYTLALAALIVALARWRGLDARRRATVAGGVWAGVLLVMGLGLWHHYTDPAFRKSPDWRGLVAFLDARVGPGDLVVPNTPDPAFSYYYRGQHATVPAAAGADPAETVAQLASALEEHRALWFMPAVNPAWDAEMTALHWLEANAQRIDDMWIGTFRVQQWRSWRASRDELEEISARTRIRVGDFASMVGYDVYPSPLPRGVVPASHREGLRLILYWAPFASASRDYTVFVHLEGQINPATETPLWAQCDHPPQDGRAPTSQWEAGALLRDVFFVDLSEVTAGNYVLCFGLYDPLTGERINLEEPGGDRGESITLFDVAILPD